jgi:hypothetical protein
MPAHQPLSKRAAVSRHVTFCDGVTRKPCRMPRTSRAASNLGDANFGGDRTELPDPCLLPVMLSSPRDRAERI